MKPPVIKHEILSWPAKITIFVAISFSLLIAGFALGVVAATTTPTKPVEYQSLSLPQPSIRRVQPKQNDEPIRHASNWQFDNLEQEIKCLADNIYFEGRNQTKRGKLAIGLVTINRVKSKHYPNSICEVVWQQSTDSRTGKKVAQFSWTLDGKPDKVANKPVYKRIRRIAQAMIYEGTLDNLYDFTEGATHYHADYVDPYWSNSMRMIAQIDNHIFYR
jgi:spore germination cell wall hydrolase CwlJ-like protein